ncbi:sugar transporter, partial [Flavobacteriaceae bacterium]|nr:sugar transporter [Flavobacteriaceae bacterium]
MAQNNRYVENATSFDVKGFLIKLLRFWPWFVVTLACTYSYAYYISVRKLPVYWMENTISIKDDQNPFFTANTSLTFNWGGTTDKVNTALITLRSRTHNEKVVSALNYYVSLQTDGKYQRVDAYGATPFRLEVDTAHAQLIGTTMTIEFVSPTRYELDVQWGSPGLKNVQYFDQTKRRDQVHLDGSGYSAAHDLGEAVATDFLGITLWPLQQRAPEIGKKYYLSFSVFDQAVKGYLGVNIRPESNGSSVLKMSMTGLNKARMVDYLNGSTQVLAQDMLARKNLFATKTIRFIDSSLALKSKDLKNSEDRLNAFKNRTAVFDLEGEGELLREELTALDQRQEAIERELNYYSILETY